MQPLQCDLRLSDAKDTSITPAAAAARNLDAAIPLRSADTELQRTIELQHTTVENVACMQQFQCTKHLNKWKTQKHSINKEDSKSPGTFSSTARDNSRQIRRQNDARDRRTSEPTFLRSRTSVYPKKTHCFVQMLTFKSHPWCGSSNAISQEWLAKQSQRQYCRAATFDQRWRNHSTAVCGHWVATHNRIATLLWNTSLGCSSSNAQSISTHAKHKSTAATKKRTSHLEPSFPLSAQFETDTTAKRRPRPSHKRANFSPRPNLRLPEKNTMFRANANIQIASMMRQFQCNQPRMTCKTQSESQRQYCRAATFRPALTQPFHCDLRTLSCNAQ